MWFSITMPCTDYYWRYIYFTRLSKLLLSTVVPVL